VSEIKNFQAAMEVKTGKKLKILHIDQGERVHVRGIRAVLRRTWWWSVNSPPPILPNRMGWWSDATRA
jgi:hypothetical protein